MKRVFILIPFLVCLLCSSCINVLEEIFINKDGSGRYQVTYDMSGILQPETLQMIQGLQEMSGEEGNVDINLGDMANIEMDSFFSFDNEEMLAGLNQEQQAILKKGSMQMNVSGSSGVMEMNITIDFDDVKEIGTFFELMAQVQEDDASALPLSELSSVPMLQITGKTLDRFDPQSTANSDIQSSLGMMGMFFQDATYTTKYYFPKKIKSTTMEGAKVEGNMLTIENNLLDIMTQKASLEGEIKFK